MNGIAFDKNSYDREYSKTHYERVVVYMPKGKRDELKAAAKAAGMSVNDLIKTAVYNTYGVNLL